MQVHVAPPAATSASCGPPAIGGVKGQATVPINKPLEFAPIDTAMQELLYQAINCDLTRVATMQWLSSGDDHFYPWLDITYTHHGMEHGWGENKTVRAAYDKIQLWFMEQIATFLKRLKATPEGNGSMLDNCAVLLMSEMWGTHEHDNALALVAGKAGGAFKTGRNLAVKRAPHNNLLLTLVNAMGVNVTTVGDPKYCTGPLALG